MKLTKQQIIPMFLISSPSFEVRWMEYLKEWGDAKERGIHNDLSEFVHHGMKLSTEKKYTEVPEIFKVVENLEQNGDTDTKEAITMGFLETLQNNMKWEELPENFIVQYLGPVSKKEWEELNKFWDKVEKR